MASTNFINECKNRANANRLGKIIIDGITSPITNSDNLQSFEIDSGCYTDGNIIGSVYAKCLKANFIAEQNNLTDKPMQAQIGVKYTDLSNEYINMGKYKVERPSNEITANMSQITAYSDLYTNLDSKYICNIDYSTGDKTLSDLYVDVCNQLGLTPVTTTFINSTISITANPFTNGEKNRTVLQTIAKISCSFIDIDNDTNKIDLCWLSSSKNPDYTFYKNDYSSVEGGQVVCGPINCLIIKNSQVDDENVTIKDDESIKKNGENSIIISEDYILYNSDLRQQAITDIWNRVKGMKYVDCKLTTYYGKPFLKLGDYIRIYTSETEYFDTYVLKHNFTYDGSFTSIIESPVLTEQEIKTKQNISLGEALRNTQIIVDKQLGKITSIVDEMNTKVEDITTTTQTSTGGNSLYLKEALESNALEYSADGRCEQETRSGKNLYNFKDTTNVGNGVTTDEDGWITITADNTSGTSVIYRNYFTKNLKLKTNTNYAIVMEVKNVSRTGDNAIWPVSVYSTTEGQFDGGYRYDLATLSNNTIKVAIRVTKSNFTNISNGLRTFLSVGAGAKSTITFRLSVLEDTTVTANNFEYEAFGASPSPDYPSEIKTIKGIRNLFDKSTIVNGKFINSNGDYETDSNSFAGDFISIENSKEYCVSAKTKNVKRVVYYDGSKAFMSRQLIYRTSNVLTIPSNAMYIKLSCDYVDLNTLQLEEGTVANSYVPFGTYEKIKITGKNVFNIQKWLNATLPVVRGVLNSKTSNGISLTATANDCYTETYNMSQTTNKTAIDNFGFEIEENTDYTFYTKKSDTIGGVNYVFYFDKDYKYISLKSNNSITNENFLNFTTPPNAKYICLRLGINKSGDTVEFSNIMLLKGTITTTPDYEPSKEKEVLIDLAKENLFEYDTSTNIGWYTDIPNCIKEAGTYTLEINNPPSVGVWAAWFVDEQKNRVGDWIKPSSSVYKKSIFTVSKSQIEAPYIRFLPPASGQHNLKDYGIKIYEGYSPYYELNSIGDIKDKLEIVNGLAVIQKKIGKVVLDGTETGWGKSGATGNVSYYYSAVYGTSGYKFNDIDLTNVGTTNSTTPVPAYCDYFQSIAGNKIFTDIKGLIFDYISNTKTIELRLGFGLDTTITTVDLLKAWLKANPVTVYYILNEPETITLPNTNISLYENVNHVTLVEDLETTTSIKYLRKTPISGEYALNQDLNKTNSNLADTNNQLSQTQSDIDNTKTNLNNNYYNKEQVDSINSTTTQNITQIRNTMEQNITSTNASISKIQEEITNGVSKVTTTTGTFDENGLNISKSGQQMSSTLDWDGLEVVRDKGKATETEVLTVRSAGVEAENMTVRNFFIKRPIRIEKCRSITDSTKVGLGFFWIGE